MNIYEILYDDLSESYLTEGRKYFKTSKISKKLILRLKRKRKLLKEELKKETNDLKVTQMKRDIYAINKTLPIIKDFEKYFIKLEDTFSGESDREKRKKIKSHYDEIRFLFIEKLYKTMKIVGQNSASIVLGAITTLLFAIIFIPGGGFVMLLPTISLIRNVNKAKEKVNDKKFIKDLNYLSKQLKRYQS